MCACGCFLLIGIAAALAYCIIHGLWLTLGAIVVFSAVLGWLGNKARQKSPSAKKVVP